MERQDQCTVPVSSTGDRLPQSGRGNLLTMVCSAGPGNSFADGIEREGVLPSCTVSLPDKHASSKKAVYDAVARPRASRGAHVQRDRAIGQKVHLALDLPERLLENGDDEAVLGKANEGWRAGRAATSVLHMTKPQWGRPGEPGQDAGADRPRKAKKGEGSTAGLSTDSVPNWPVGEPLLYHKARGHTGLHTGVHKAFHKALPLRYLHGCRAASNPRRSSKRHGKHRVTTAVPELGPELGTKVQEGEKGDTWT